MVNIVTEEEIQNKLDFVYNLPEPKDDEYNIAVSFPGHDSSIVIAKGREILEVYELERFFNLKNFDWSVKHRKNYPTDTYEEFSFELIQFYLQQISQFIKKKYPVKFKHCFILKEIIMCNGNGIKPHHYFDIEKIVLVSHHGAHAQNAFYQSGFDEALAIVYDGGSPDHATNVFYLNKNEKPKVILHEEISLVKNYGLLGLLFEDIKYDLNRCNFSLPGKMMALASYGTPNLRMIKAYRNFLLGVSLDINKENLIDFFSSIPHSKLFKYWEDVYQDKRFLIVCCALVHAKKILEDAGVKNVRELLPLIDKTWEPSVDSKKYDESVKNHYVSNVKKIEMSKAFNIAATVQLAFERNFFNIFGQIIEQHPGIPIILSGGGALNITLNTKVKTTYNRDVFVGPDPSDCGLGLGAMLSYLRPEKPFDNPYTGFELLDKDSLSNYVMDYCGVNFRKSQYSVYNLSNHTSAFLATLISKGKILGVARGRSERGPRALGNRSIICSASIPGMNDILNSKVKFREWFRPFAPVVREKDLTKYFDWDTESSYMNFCVNVREEYREKLQPVTHVDGTARVQTLRRKQNWFIYDILTELEKLTGIGVMINTSFNVNGRPIINTVRDAFNMLQNTELDGIIIENTLILKKDEK